MTIQYYLKALSPSPKPYEQTTYCSVVEVRFIMATDPVIHHLEVLAIWVPHIQTCEHGDLVVQLPNSGLC